MDSKDSEDPNIPKVNEWEIPFLLKRKNKFIRIPEITKSSHGGSWALALNHLLKGGQEIFLVNGFCFIGTKDDGREVVPDFEFKALEHKEFMELVYSVQSFAVNSTSVLRYRKDVATPVLVQQYRVRRVTMKQKFNSNLGDPQKLLQDMQKAFEDIGSTKVPSKNRFSSLTVLDEALNTMKDPNVPADQRRALVATFTDEEKEIVRNRQAVHHFLHFNEKFPDMKLWSLCGYSREEIFERFELPQEIKDNQKSPK